ncbi:MAG: tetratricopeptide repeat protein [Myxococcaceae bacterium]|nr:tetratricopeptide repeat protein [Myxococcaceae bacterium]
MRRALLTALLLAACATPAPALAPRDEARRLLGARSWPEAVKLLEQLHREAPGDVELARLLAEAHVKNGSGPLLLERLTGREDAIACFQRGLIRFATARDAGGPAIDEFRKAVRAAPQEPELHYRLGLALLESEADAEARTELERAVSLAPDHPGWFLPLAKARGRVGDHDGAVQALHRVVDAGPTEAELATARALMEQLTATRLPETARARFEQGLQWLQVADVPQQAIVAFEEVLQDFPDLPEVHSVLGLAYLRIDDAARAVDELQRAIELAPKDGRPHLYLGQLYLGKQRTAQAREQLEKAVALNPLLDDAWTALGDLALDRRDGAEAKRCYRAWVSLAPRSFPPRGKLALVLQQEADWAGAQRQLEQALEHEPENAEVWLRLGLLHTDHAQHARGTAEREAAKTQGVRWLQKVLEQQPENAMASQALALLTAARP